ncbi:Tetratricopeptide-like helical [Penicillium cataractarum]|uniref:Mitochondrial division protein 1 n=1 Tax=Penicillium cataractarum TaxID=2100454 RepID=A0A9W9UUR4_9EURO|nr:Tetratricopeptide-like helical [Penicillium cataractarum]KAJ5355481.1 Tetratricopeptide-like helical [Penicillium cataractarum]
MARISDLITDSKLPASFLPDCSVETVHRFQESDPASRQRLVIRPEHWRRQRKIGGGGFGSVWLEECTQGGRLGAMPVRAVKQINVDMRLGPIDYNPPGQLLIAMEYLELGDRFTYLYRQPPGPPLQETEAKEITYQILDGMNMMHDNGFAHRDLKPNNILIKSHPPNEWWIKLADFAILPLKYRDTFLEAFPVSRLTGVGISQPGVDFILSLMHPYPNDRVTARSAISNMWLQPLISHFPKSTTIINGKPHKPSSAATSNEEFASWTTKPSPKAPWAGEDSIDPYLAQVKERWSVESQLPGSHSHNVELVTLSSDDRTLASSSRDQTVRHWKPVIGSLHRILKHSCQIRSMAFSPSGQLLACGCSDNTVRLWDPMTGALLQTLKHVAAVGTVNFSPNGRLLASGSDDGKVLLWDTVTGALCRTIDRGDSVDDRRIGVAFLRDVRLLDECAISDYQHSGTLKSTALSPDSRVLPCICDAKDGERTVELRDIATGALRETRKGHRKSFFLLAFSPNRRILASDFPMLVSVSSGVTVLLWDTATGAIHQTLEGHSALVRSVAFSPDGRVLASSSHDRTVRLWDTATSALQQTLESHSSIVHAVAFSRDGRLLASVSADNTVRPWGFPSS